MIRLPRFLAPLGLLKRHFWITFLVASLVSEGGDFVLGKLIKTQDRDVADGLLTISGFYQWLVTLPRSPSVGYTAIVEIDHNDTPGVSDKDVCNERRFLARLLERIDAADPAVIVIDKYFGNTACIHDPAGTRELLAAVTRIREKGHYVVVGLRATEIENADDSRDQPTSFVEDTLPFDPPGSTGQEGILNLPEDSRRLPLQWTVYKAGEGEKHQTVVVENALALTAALDYNSRLLSKDWKLRRLLANGEHPFMGFVPMRSWAEMHAHFYASEIICGRRTGPNDRWEDCKSAMPVHDLSHRVVLIGENDPDDVHPSVMGRMPGFYLHANYIEALLDSNFLKPGGALWDDGSGFVFLLALELILIVWRQRVAIAIGMISGLLLSSYLFLYFMTVNAGYYVDPIPVEATAVIIKIIQLWVPSPESSVSDRVSVEGSPARSDAPPS